MRLSNLDPSSFSTPENVIIEHINLVWDVKFDPRVLSGTAELFFKVITPDITQIFLDVCDLDIQNISVKCRQGEIPVNYTISETVEHIGSKLLIDLPTKTCGNIVLLFEYKTSPLAGGLLWLSPEQTTGKNFPFLFSQCQPIYARSLMPCQDTPNVKFTYNAEIRHDPELTALMSAIIVKTEPGITKFEQKVPIPSYLLAIAVGALVSRQLSPISQVWAEAEVADEAATEFSETSQFLEKAIEICGPYVWKRYDLLVLPPSFPYGGMENPCLTFVTPTVLAGDKSLADVVAHEIAHSWTGNLVTNRNFEHFWLNEGFTVYVEGKIVGKMRGKMMRDFHSIRGLSELSDCLKVQLKDTPEITKLIVDLTNLSPDDAFSTVPYMKGSTFLRYLENLLGGPEIFDPFFRFYLKKYKNKSVITDDFKATLYEYFSEDEYQELLSQVDWELWLHGTGMPPIIPKYVTTLSDEATKHADLWKNKSLSIIQSSPILKESLSPLQIIELLSQLIDKNATFDADKLAFFASTYKVNGTKNSEIRFRYLRLCIRARLESALPEIFAFANSNFRMKFIRPIYKELSDWPMGKAMAIENFQRVKMQMMKMLALHVAKDLGISY